MVHRKNFLRKIFQRQFARFALIAAAVFLSAYALELAPTVFKPLDHILDDWRTRLSWHMPGNTGKYKNHEGRVVIVDIDEKSLAEQGPWPWGREKVSSLVSSLIDHYGVSGVALDIVFPEKKEKDAGLSTQLKRQEVTGAVLYDLIGRQLPELQQGLPPLPIISVPSDAPRIVGLPVTSNYPELMPNRVGHITPLFDSDGSIRRLPPIICHQMKTAECRPLLGIAAFMGLLTQPSLSLRRGESLFSPAWELVVVEAGNVDIVKIPVNRDGALTVPYRHKQEDWTSVSATQILRHQANPAMLRGSMVLVGATALGMSDVVYTPVSPVASGLEAHAEVMVALLDNSFLHVPQYGRMISVAAVFPLAVILYFLLLRFQAPMQRALIIQPWLFGSWLYVAALAMFCYVRFDLLIPLTPLALFPIFTVLLIVSFELYFSASDKKGISSLLAAYLPKQVAVKLTAASAKEGAMDTSVDASRRLITVMFADVRGFTGIAEGHKPEVVAKLMHRVFSEMAASVVAHDGTIDKFIGDAVMAFWNAPEDDALHAFHALAAAQDMLRRIHQLEPYCQELGVAQVKIGIGIETGFALVGNFGSEHRRTYTALGETVVLASRIEGLTGQFERSILVGEVCAKTLNFSGLEALGNVQIRGRQREVALFSPIFVPAEFGKF